MSDPQHGERDHENREPAYGEPVDESATPEDKPAVDDVVGSANDSLAEAEAASRADRGDSSFSFADRGSDLSIDYGKYSDDGAPVAATAVSSEPLYRAPAEPADSGSGDRDAIDRDAADRDAAGSDAATPATTAYSSAAATNAYGSADETPTTVTPSEPAATRRSDDAAATTRLDTHSDSSDETRAVSEQPVQRSGEGGAPTAVYSQQPIFVQAPEAPRQRGNRGAAGLIGLLAAVVFAVLYLVAGLALTAANDGLAFADVPTTALQTLTTFGFWVPVAVFFLGFWLLGAFINRGRWGLWVVFGLLVGVAAYAGHILGQLFEAPFWSIAPSQAGTIVGEQLLAPLAVIAFVLGREITIWFGAWVSARGRRVTEINDEAQREYERTLEAGPQLHQY
ncbi:MULTISPECIES: ABC transporter [unclassified Microbacterium]|uniref:ABC transporter n=1 Tax=unclassified Microbacterium TaxID=2609290 RepID=UPI003865A5DE